MLSAWFTCRCLEASPASTAIYLGILEILADPASPSGLVHAALGELARLDVWMRIHAFPRVCAWSRRVPVDDGPRAALHVYLDELVDLLAEDLRGQFVELRDLVATLGDAARAVQALRRGAAATQSLARPERPRGGPYLDLLDELPAVLALGLAANLPGEVLDAVQGEFDLLAEAARRGAYGRLPLLLALQVRRLRGTRDDIKGLRKVLAPVPEGQLLASPDLLEFVVQALFEDHKDGVAGILVETRTFGAYLQLFGDVEAAGGEVERLGLESARHVVAATPLVLWTGALWELAARIGPTACARTFGGVWGPQDVTPQRDNSGLQKTPSKATRTALWRLFDMRFPEQWELRRELRDVFANGKPEDLVALEWSIHSPWIDLDRDDGDARDADARPVIRYPGATQLAVLRLTIAASVAVTCVLAVPEREERSRLLALVVHAWSVLDVRRPMPIDPFDSTDDVGMDSPERRLRGLALYVQRRLARLGFAERDVPSPDEFVGLKDIGRSSGSGELRTFRTEVVPSVLVSWLQHAFGQAIPGHPSSRWLDVLERDGVHGDRTRLTPTLEADLLQRYVMARPFVYEERHEWWTRQNRHHRRLLLSPQVPRWHWQELADRNLGDTGRLIRAIELVAEEPGRWRSLLNERMTLHLRDPYVRRRLHELLTSESLQDAADQQMDIVCALLECGSPYDLYHLFLWIYPADKWAWDAATSTQSRVRDLAVGPLVRARRVVDLAADDMSARNPWRVHNERARVDLLGEVIERIAWFAAHLPLGRELAALLQADDEPAHCFAGDLEVLNGRRTIHTDSSVDVPDHRIDAVVVNLNHGRGFARAPALPDNRCVDLLALPAADRDVELARASREGRRVLGRIVDVETQGGSRRYRLAIGLPAAMEHVEPATRPPRELGEWVSVQPSKRASAAAEHGALLESPPQRIAVGTRAAAKLRRTRPTDPTIELEVADDPHPAWDLEVWVPSAVHALGEWKPDVIACRRAGAASGAGGEWWPVELDIVGLLLDGRGERTWGLVPLDHGRLFSVRPGMNVALPAEVWDSEDHARLVERLALGKDGLIVTVQVERAAEGALRVVLGGADQPEGPFDTRNIAWARAFKLGALVKVQRGGDGTWTTDTPPGVRALGFPEQVRVLDGAPSKPRTPTWAEAEAEVEVLSWDADCQRRGRLICVRPQSYRLEIRDGERQAFLQRWFSLGPGDALTLSRESGRGYRTRSNIDVHVDIDTLSLRPARVSQKWPVDGRHAGVRSAKWRERAPLLVDPATLPLAVREAGEGVGMVYQVSTGIRRAEVLWLGLGEAPIVFEAPERLRQGTRLRVSRNGGAWRLFAEPPEVQTRALWRIVESLGGHVEVTIVGRGRLRGGRDTWFAQVGAGELLALPPEASGRLFARCALRDLATAPGPGLSGSNHPEKRPFELPDGTRVVSTRITFGAEIWHGVCLEHAPSQVVTISRATLVFGEPIVVDGQELFDVHRRFDLQSRTVMHLARPAVAARRVVVAERQRPSIDAERRKQWEAYLADPHDLTARRVGTDDTIELQSLMVPDGAGGWTPQMTLAVGKGPWLAWNRGLDLKVRIVRNADGAAVVSCRAVPAYDVRTYRKDVCEGVPPGQNYDPTLPLKYVEADGPEASEHMFEWAPGRVLRVPESQLLFDGKPFSRANPGVFHGDIVRTIRFEHGPSQDVMLMHIEGARLALSEGTSLYLQAKKFQLLHVLNLKVDRQLATADIASVVGFQERDEDQHTATFSSSRAVLRRETAARIAARTPADAKEVRVIGRLDTAEFRRSSGARVVFDHVRMDFVAFGGMAALSPGSGRDRGPDGVDTGDLVFMEARDIVQPPNDYALRMDPIDGLHPSDRGKSFARSLLLLRREFSAREDLLPRIFRSHGPDAFAERWIPVRLRDDGGGKVSCTLLGSTRRLPVRRPDTFRSRVANSETPVFGVVVEHTAAALVLELRPTVFVQVPTEDLADRHDRFARGEVLGISRGERGKLRANRAVYSDGRYVGDGRPAVVLPLNRLAKTGDVFANDAFSVGGLPGLRASFSGAEDRLMRAPHPKVATLMRLHDRRYCIVSPWATHTAGRVVVAADGAVAVRSRDGKRTATPIAWTDVSYCDGSIAKIKGLLARRWSYHDAESFYWDGNRTAKCEVQPGSAGDGPIFFDEVDRRLTLRYRPEHLLRQGFPVAELVRTLEPIRKGWWFAVVGASRDVHAIWIELCPGRVVEVPCAILVVHTGAGERSLEELAHTAFATGDRVQLELARGQHDHATTAVDRIVLLSHKPGPRGAYNERMLLRVASPSIEDGGAWLGDGRFGLCVPQAFPRNTTTVAVGADGRIDTRDVEPRIGSGVLLGADEQGLTACGLPGRVVELVGRSSDDEDPLWNLLLDVHTTPERAAAVLAAAGGALPVTIEAVAPGRLQVSRRHQAEAQRRARAGLCHATVLGPLDGQRLVLRAGGALLVLPTRTVVAGLPAIRQVLKGSVVLDVWLRWTGREFVTGLGDEATQEFFVHGLDAIERGLVCRAERSDRLIWIPAPALAWAELDAAAIKQLFVGRRLLVRRGDDGSFSLIDTTRATRELRGLTVGDELAVEVLPVVGPRRVLVAAPLSGVVFVCETEKQPKDGQKLRVRITDRSLRAPSSLVAVPCDEYVHRLDLSRAIHQLLRTRDGTRPEHKALADAMKRVSNASRNGSSPARPWSPDAVGLALVAAYHEYLDGDGNRNDAARHLGLVREWAAVAEKLDEVPLLLPLVAVLLLDAYARDPDVAALAGALATDPEDVTRRQIEWRAETARMLEALLRRARRSLHLEVLARAWLLHKETRTRTHRLWHRLQVLGRALAELQADKTPSAARGREILTDIRSFGRAAMWQGEPTLLSIAAALGAAMGDPAMMASLHRHADLLGSLIAVGSPPSPSDPLSPLQRARLVAIVNHYETDIVLLDPIPLRSRVQ